MNSHFGIQICVIGPERSGKSTFIASELQIGSISSNTLFRSEKNYHFQNFDITCSWIDIPGNSFYSNMCSNITAVASCVLCVIDLDDIKSLQHAKKWIEQRKSNIPWFLLGNKKTKNNALPKQMIDDFVEQYKLNYFEICALNCNEVNDFISNHALPMIFKDINEVVDPVRIMGKQILIGQNLVQDKTYQSALLSIRDMKEI